MTEAGFVRILAAALPDVPPDRRAAVARLCRRYAGCEAEVGPLEREAIAIAPTDPPPRPDV